MRNPEKTKGTGQSRMGNPDTLATLCTQNTGRRQTKQKTQHRKLKRPATQTRKKPGMNRGARNV